MGKMNAGFKAYLANKKGKSASTPKGKKPDVLTAGDSTDVTKMPKGKKKKKKLLVNKGGLVTPTKRMQKLMGFK